MLCSTANSRRLLATAWKAAGPECSVLCHITGFAPPDVPSPEKSLKCSHDSLQNAAILLQKTDLVSQPLSLGSMSSPLSLLGHLSREIHPCLPLRTPTLSPQHLGSNSLPHFTWCSIKLQIIHGTPHATEHLREVAERRAQKSLIPRGSWVRHMGASLPENTGSWQEVKLLYRWLPNMPSWHEWPVEDT